MGAGNRVGDCRGARLAVGRGRRHAVGVGARGGSVQVATAAARAVQVETRGESWAPASLAAREARRHGLADRVCPAGRGGRDQSGRSRRRLRRVADARSVVGGVRVVLVGVGDRGRVRLGVRGHDRRLDLQRLGHGRGDGPERPRAGGRVVGALTGGGRHELQPRRQQVVDRDACSRVRPSFVSVTVNTTVSPTFGVGLLTLYVRARSAVPDAAACGTNTRAGEIAKAAASGTIRLRAPNDSPRRVSPSNQVATPKVFVRRRAELIAAPHPCQVTPRRRVPTPVSG